MCIAEVAVQELGATQITLNEIHFNHAAILKRRIIEFALEERRMVDLRVFDSHSKVEGIAIFKMQPEQFTLPKTAFLKRAFQYFGIAEVAFYKFTIEKFHFREIGFGEIQSVKFTFFKFFALENFCFALRIKVLLIESVVQYFF